MKKAAKKISSLLVAAIIINSLSLFILPANASGVWNCTSAPSGSAFAEAEESNLDLYFKSEGNEGKANAERLYDLSGNEEICISFKSEFSSDSTEAVRRLNIQNNSLTTTEILNITGTSLKLFGTPNTFQPEPNRAYQFDIGIKPDTGYAVVWIDGEQVYQGVLGNKWKNFNYSAMKVLFRNTSSGKNSSLESRWQISDYYLSDTDEGFIASPEDGESYIDSSRESIDIRFNGAKAPAVYAAENFELSAEDKPVDVITERVGAALRIIPVGGLEPGRHYTLRIKAISDIFCNLQQENALLEFTTADSGYERAEVKISADETLIYDTDTANISIASKSSQGIIKTVIYVNDDIYTQHDGKLENIEFSAQSGTYKIYAEVIDGMGAKVVSEPIIIEILHNDAPTISVTGLVNGASYDAAKLKSVSISAADTDGSVEMLELDINGDVTALNPAEENILDLSGLNPAIYNVRISAADNLGTYSEKLLSFTLLSGYVTKNVFKSDFNTYVSDGTASPGLSFVLNGDAQLLSSEEYGKEHGTVVIFKTDGGEAGGTNANGSWGRIVTSNTTDGFIITMDINLLSDKGQFYYMVKHPTMSPLAMDVQIKEGQLNLNDSGSAAVKKQLDPGRWYTTVYRVDLKNHTYSYWLDGELLADEFKFGNPAITQADTRLVMEFPDKIPVECGIAFDNLYVDYITPIPQITAVTADEDGVSTKLSPYAKQLNVTVNTALAPATVNKESVQLYCGEERVCYDSVSYDNDTRKILIKLSEKLRSNKSYTLKLTDSVTGSDGSEIPNGISTDFDVDYKNIDISKMQINKDGEKISAEGCIYNRTGESGNCYVIVNVFNESRLINTRAEKVHYGRGAESHFKTSDVSMNGGTRAEVYVWDSLTKPKPLSSEIYFLE